MKCNYCNADHEDSVPHYCLPGRDFLMVRIAALEADNKRLRDALELVMVVAGVASEPYNVAARALGGKP